MLIFLLPKAAKDASRAGIDDDALRRTVRRTEAGLVDASLGLCLVKQRIAREGQGRSGGYRSILFYRKAETAVFLHIFAKNAKATMTPRELAAAREFAAALAGLGQEQFTRLSVERGWKEIRDEPSEEDIPE